jgi:hypothetical protein
VKETPVKYLGLGGVSHIHTGYKAIIRNDSGDCLALQKSSYAPMYVQEFTESTQRILEASGFEFQGYQEGRGGRVIISVMKNNKENIKIGGNKIDDYLMLGNSFDCSYPFFLGTTTELLRCENQFSHIKELSLIKHYKNSAGKRASLMNEIEAYFKNRDLMYNNFNKMIEVNVTPELKEKAIRYILQLKEEEKLADLRLNKFSKIDTLEIAINAECHDLGNNLWGLFNGVTKYTTHDLVSKVNNVFGNIFGQANNLNQRAYSFASDLVLS